MREKPPPIPLLKEGVLSTSTCSTLTCAPSRSALAFATRRAVGEMSQAVTWLSGMSSASVMAMQPLPVPMSRIFWPLAIGFWLFALSMMRRHRCSVSGRGIRMPGSTWNVRPQKSATPKIYCTGSWSASLLAISSSSAWQSADNCVSLPR